MTTVREQAQPRNAAPRASARRGIGGWIAIGVALLIVGGIGAVLSGASQWSERDVLDPESAGADGAQALAEILREQGIDVVVARDRAAAAEALGEFEATLVLPDTPALSAPAVHQLADAGNDVVLIQPRARTLRLLMPGAQPAGFGPGELVGAQCDLPEALRSGSVVPGDVYDGSGPIVECYRSGAGSGLLVAEDGARRISAIDGRSLFANDSLADNGNAALAVNLMGRHPVVVWYAPGIGDTDLTSDDVTLGDLTPPWVSPVIVLLLVAGIAAGVWRGRRFGPLVHERLPVTVRAAETTEGRARLYARSRDAVHAADQLRIGVLRRVSRLLGLGPSASATEIADAAADRLGWDRGAVRGILFDEVPTTDAQLVALRDRLRHLEGAVRETVRPGRNAP